MRSILRIAILSAFVGSSFAEASTRYSAKSDGATFADTVEDGYLNAPCVSCKRAPSHPYAYTYDPGSENPLIPDVSANLVTRDCCADFHWVCAQEDAVESAYVNEPACTPGSTTGFVLPGVCTAEGSSPVKRLVACVASVNSDLGTPSSEVLTGDDAKLCVSTPPPTEESVVCENPRLCTDAENCFECTSCSSTPTRKAKFAGVESTCYVAGSNTPVSSGSMDEFRCFAEEAEPTCTDTCTYKWFCAPAAPETFTGNEAVCANTDVTTGFPACTDETTEVTRTVLCLGTTADSSETLVANDKCSVETKPTTSKQCPDFKYVCAPTGTTEATIAAVSNKSCDDGLHFAGTGDCYNEESRAVLCYDAVTNTVDATKCVGDSEPLSSRAVSPVTSGCDSEAFEVRYAVAAPTVEAPAVYDETVDISAAYADCAACVAKPSHAFPVCFHTAFKVVAEDKCGTVTTLTDKVCEDEGCTTEWRCAAAEAGLSDAAVCVAGTDVGFEATGCEESDDAELTRAVGCYAVDANDASFPLAETFCSEVKPATTKSNACVYEQLCAYKDGESDKYRPCVFTCAPCATTPTSNGTPTCVKEIEGVFVPVTDEQEQYYCDAAPTQPTCTNTCRSEYVCAGPSATDVSTFGSCANNNGFTLPENYKDGACLDDLVQRSVKCANVYDKDGVVTPVEFDVPEGTACADKEKPVAVFDAPECQYAWKCQMGAGETLSFVDCTPTTGVCGATKCSEGKYDLTIACVNQDNTVNEDKCDTGAAPEITPAACVNNSECAFNWECTAGDFTRPCGADNFCSSDGTALPVTATCKGTRDAAPAEDADCALFFGAKPESLPVTACTGSWLCKTETGYAACRDGDVLNDGLKLTCPVPKDAHATCYKSTYLAERECVKVESETSSTEVLDVESCPVTAPKLEGGQCYVAADCSFSYACVPNEGSFVPDIDLSCDDDNHFNVPSKQCYATSTFTRQVACYNSDLDIVSKVADKDCTGEAPVAEKEFVMVDTACAFEPRCAPSADDFSTAVKCSDDDDSGYGSCVVACTTASKTRVTKCFNADLNVYAEDAKCVDASALPTKLTADCVAPAKLAALSLKEDSVVVGEDVTVRWCYYPGAVVPSADAKATITLKSAATPSTFPSVRISTYGVSDLSADFALPIVPPGEATLAIAYADQTASAAITLHSRCGNGLTCANNGECDANTSTCACQPQYFGPTCSITPCDSAACVAGQSTCSNTGSQPGVCMCAPGFSGRHCEVNDECPTACLNKGFKSDCAETCECVNEWEGDTCATCPLTCTSPAAGKADTNCSKCVCNRGYNGESCQCRVAYGAISFPKAPASILEKVWITAFSREIALVAGLNLSDFTVEVVDTAKRTFVITIQSCPNTDNLVAFFRFKTISDVNAVYSAWAKIVDDLQSPSSVLKNSDALAQAGDFDVAPSMYDPACTGETCPNGANPFPPEPSPSSDDDNTTTIIVAVVVSVGGVAIILAIVLGLYCNKKACWKPEQEPVYGFSDKETDFVYNNRVSVYARPSVAMTSVEAAKTRTEVASTDAIFLAMNTRDSPKNQRNTTSVQSHAITSDTNAFGYKPASATE